MTISKYLTAMSDKVTYWTQHPEICRFTAALCLVNVLSLAACVMSNNIPGVILNSVFLLVNTASTINSTLDRNRRLELRRQILIRSTVGE